MKYTLVIIEEESQRSSVSDVKTEFHNWSVVADLRSRGTILASGRPAPRTTARTVSWGVRAPVVTDGPFLEAKESVAGVVMLEVESEEQALDIAMSWPGRQGYRIEVRPFSQTSYEVASQVLAAYARDEADRLVASLTRHLGDFDLAEEFVRDAIQRAGRVAARHRPAQSNRPPASPGKAATPFPLRVTAVRKVWRTQP